MASNNNSGTSKVAAMRMFSHQQSPQYVHGATDDTGGLHDVGRVPVESVVSRAKRTLVGRNDLCPCGSLLKFKKCHGRSKPIVRPMAVRKKQSTSDTLREIAQEGDE